jgi:hypothetical protein
MSQRRKCLLRGINRWKRAEAVHPGGAVLKLCQKRPICKVSLPRAPVGAPVGSRPCTHELLFGWVRRTLSFGLLAGRHSELLPTMRTRSQPVATGRNPRQRFFARLSRCRRPHICLAAATGCDRWAPLMLRPTPRPSARALADEFTTTGFGRENAGPGEGSLPQLPWSRPSTIGRVAEFVPPDFEVPLGLETSEFVLEPLGPEHNEQDYDAWTSSMEHIAATPGYPDGSWPREMTRDENRADLQRHADDFRTRKGFTYTVLDPASRDVIGCVYIYPLPDGDYDACALTWVRESHAHLDTPLWRAVSEWLESDWPFASVQYAPRA